MSTFAGLLSADFDAFLPNKWRSNVFNRERLEVKQRLLALGREVYSGLVAADGAPLVLEASVEHPALWNHKQVEAQHLYFSRSEGSRKELDALMNREQSLASIIDDPTPLRNHAFLAVSLTNGELDVAFKLHPDARVDRQNLVAKAADHFEGEKLTALLRALSGFRVGVLPELTAAEALDEAGLAAQLEALEAASGKPALAAPARLFYVGRSLRRDEAMALGPEIVAWVHAQLLALVPVYQAVVWSRDNDYISIRETLQKEKQVKRQKGLAKNDTVRIVRGIFAGKSGVVQELDAKGGLRVLVGKVAVKLAAEDVAKS